MYKKTLIKWGRVASIMSVVAISLVGCNNNNNYNRGGNDTNAIIDNVNNVREKEERAYNMDMQALDAIKTALAIYIADPESNWKNAYNNVTTLKTIIDEDDPNKIITRTLAEIFDKNGKFLNKSSAFENVTTSDVYVRIMNGAISIKIKSRNKLFDDYVVGQPILDY